MAAPRGFISAVQSQHEMLWCVLVQSDRRRIGDRAKWAESEAEAIQIAAEESERIGDEGMIYILEQRWSSR